MGLHICLKVCCLGFKVLLERLGLQLSGHGAKVMLKLSLFMTGMPETETSTVLNAYRGNQSVGAGGETASTTPP